MITSRIGAAMAASLLALGIVVGAVGALVARDATAPAMAMDAGAMPEMMSMMGAGAMPDMMSMMGAGAMPNARSMPLAGHESHHAEPGPGSTR